MARSQHCIATPRRFRAHDDENKVFKGQILDRITMKMETCGGTIFQSPYDRYEVFKRTHYVSDCHEIGDLEGHQLSSHDDGNEIFYVSNSIPHCNQI